MLNLFRIAALIVLAIAALLFADSFRFPAEYQICGPDEYTHTKACTEYHLGPYVLLWVIGVIDAHNGLVAAIATVFIAGFTYTLRKTSLEQSQLTRQALDISDRALTISQWPRFYVDEQRFITPVSRPTPSVLPQFEYRSVFYGDSPAFVRAVYGELIFDKSIPSKPPLKKAWRIVHGIQTKGFGLPDSIVWDGDEVVTTPEACAKARHEGKWFYAIGCIVFDDLFGNQHEFGFCYRGAIGGGWGMRAGGKPYNYQRLRNEDERAEMDSLGPPKPNEPPENSAGLSNDT
ncbi:MAG: hypothetical protein P4L76_07465 [Beijerinckiaceae bacterium]|nr:hypothetical protein [Beijerinckiaceae bacterium]